MQVNNLDLLTSTQADSVNEAILQSQDLLTQFAKDEYFISKIITSFGDSYDAEVLENIRQQFESGNFSDLPQIEVLTVEELQGANGAYSVDTNTIYLAQEFIAEYESNSGLIADVLIEETGHWIDARINEVDVDGDEGAIFSALVQRKYLEDEELQLLKIEKDKNLISLDNQAIQVEFAKLSSETTSLTNNSYIDGILWITGIVTNSANRWQIDSNREISYSFWGEGSESFDDDIYSFLSPLDNAVINPYKWEDYEKDAIELALSTWSNVANIKFVKSEDNNQNVTLSFYKIDKAQMPKLDDGSTPQAIYKAPGETGQGIGYFNKDSSGWNEFKLNQGGIGFITAIHEIGHGLGLAHPHGGKVIYPGVDDGQDTGQFGLNQGIWTTMSYIDGLQSNYDQLTEFPTIPDNLSETEQFELINSYLAYGFQGTPMAFDIAAIQHLYGKNTSFKTE